MGAGDCSRWQRYTVVKGSLCIKHLYNFNVLAQRLIDTLQEIAGTPGLKGEILPHHQALIQYVRASVSGDIVGSMAGIELTEAWLFESLHRAEEKTA